LLLNAVLLCAVLLRRPAAGAIDRYLLPAHSSKPAAMLPDGTEGQTNRQTDKQTAYRYIDHAAYCQQCQLASTLVTVLFNKNQCLSLMVPQQSRFVYVTSNRERLNSRVALFEHHQWYLEF